MKRNLCHETLLKLRKMLHPPRSTLDRLCTSYHPGEHTRHEKEVAVDDFQVSPPRAQRSLSVGSVRVSVKLCQEVVHTYAYLYVFRFSDSVVTSANRPEL